MTTTTRQIVFGATALIGVIVTWYFNLQFMAETGGFSIPEFVAATYVNTASSSISNDLLVVVFTFLFWSYTETKRLNMKYWWVTVAATFSIAIAFAFPLFMLLRERAITNMSSS